MKYSQLEGLTQKDYFKKKIVNSLSRLSSPTGTKVLPGSLHEPAAVLDIPGSPFYLAFKTDGVGTKSLIADKMSHLPNKLKDWDIKVSALYSGLGIDLVASNVNDLICLGATPIAISDEISAGNKSFFLDRPKINGLITGLQKGCKQAGIIIPSGESPTLVDILKSRVFSLTGSAIGIIQPKSKIILGENLKAGDKIIGFESNGIHTNGLALARRIIEKLPHGYFTPFGSKTIGQELLKPTTIYSPLILDLLGRGIDIHYMTHITGSSFRKIARAQKDFTYVVEFKPHKIFKILQKEGKQSDYDCYQTWNMGVGFVIFVPEKYIQIIQKISIKHKIRPFILGNVENGIKRVIIKPLRIAFQYK